MKNHTKVIAEKGVQELFITREFEAPRDLVFKAFTDPELIVKWLGACDMTMRIDYMDMRSGGSYRFIHSNPQGKEFGFNGVLHEVLEPQRMIRTFEFEGLPERGHVVLETATFDPLPDNRTKLTIQSVFRSVEDRDGIIDAGMEYGVNDSHKKLDDLLEELTNQPA
jgi:uncharacterized protein YndB with AHSA1/START domain